MGKEFPPKFELVISQIKQEGFGLENSPKHLIKKFWDKEGNYIGKIQLGGEEQITLTNEDAI